MSVRLPRPYLVGCLLVVCMAPVSAAETPPTILLTPFHDVSQGLAASVPNLEAQIVSAIEIAAAGRVHVVFETARTIQAGYEADEIRALAEKGGAAYVLVGEWSPAGPAEGGDPGSDVALAIRSGHSGATAFRYHLSFGSPTPLPADVDTEVRKLADAMLRDLGLFPGAEATPPVAAAPTPSKPPPTLAQGLRTDFLRVSRDEPIEIVSDQLEVVAVGNARQFTFTDHVRVVQGDMQLLAGQLEAFYPEGASQPERLDARREVRLIEGDLEVRCDEVTYLREAGLVICRGDALLLQGCDEVRGQKIEFYLDEERVKVVGAASVVLRFDEENQSSCARGEAS